MHVPDKSIILINNGESEPNWQRPWVRYGTQKSSGTGFVIRHNEKNYVITNEHCVRFSSYLYLFKRGSSVTYKGKIILLITECDIAVLDVEDDKFWEDLVPLELGNLPARGTECLYLVIL